MEQDPIRDLIVAGMRHADARVKTAATKAHEAIKSLQELAAKVEAQHEARERVARLERELAEARAALGGTAKPAIDAKAIRAWAFANGLACPARGRPPKIVIETYALAHGTPVASAA